MLGCCKGFDGLNRVLLFVVCERIVTVGSQCSEIGPTFYIVLSCQVTREDVIRNLMPKQREKSEGRVSLTMSVQHGFRMF